MPGLRPAEAERDAGVPDFLGLAARLGAWGAWLDPELPGALAV